MTKPNRNTIRELFLLLAFIAIAACGHLHIPLDHRVFKTFEELAQGEYQLCQSDSVIMFAAEDPKMCPSKKDLNTIVSLVQNNDVLGGASVVFVNAMLSYHGHPANGCSNNDVAFVHYGFDYYRTIRHELTHMELGRRGVPKGSPGDPNHTLPIWKLINPPEDPMEDWVPMR